VVHGIAASRPTAAGAYEKKQYLLCGKYVFGQNTGFAIFSVENMVSSTHTAISPILFAVRNLRRPGLAARTTRYQQPVTETLW
jgi:hypothetical protein